jgi:hypothetical protein
MGQAEEIRNKDCVLTGCNRKAVAFCNNCRIPICDMHSKRVNQAYVCVNCLGFLKKLKLS